MLEGSIGHIPCDFIQKIHVQFLDMAIVSLHFGQNLRFSDVLFIFCPMGDILLFSVIIALRKCSKKISKIYLTIMTANTISYTRFTAYWYDIWLHTGKLHYHAAFV